LNRYTDDLESDQHSYDVHSIVQEFEDAVQELEKDISRLQSAVYRLNLLRTHLQKK
jgi:exonuclease VII small subunit